MEVHANVLEVLRDGAIDGPVLIELDESAENSEDKLSTEPPSCWSPVNKHKNIEISQNGLDIHCQRGKNVQSILTNYPVPDNYGYYYYEVHITSMKRNASIALGLGTQGTKMNVLPGDSSNSKDTIGYRNDSRRIHNGGKSTLASDPPCLEGDTVGFYVDLQEGSCYVTRNGKIIGQAMNKLKLKGPLYPSVGFGKRSVGTSVRANFGGQPFQFQVKGMKI